MKSNHVCLNCGGDVFYTAAHVMQEWCVDATGDFVNVATECCEVTHEPDDGNIWSCVACGNEAEIAETSFTVGGISQCCKFMAKVIGKNYSVETWSLNAKQVYETVVNIYGRKLYDAVLASTIKNNSGDGRINPKNAEWAEGVELPSSTRFDIIRGDLTCHGVHVGLVDMLADDVRRGKAS